MEAVKVTADVVEFDADTGLLTVDGTRFPVALMKMEHLTGRPDEEDAIAITFAFRRYIYRGVGA